jgi:hypothetical protein
MPALTSQRLNAERERCIGKPSSLLALMLAFQNNFPFFLRMRGHLSATFDSLLRTIHLSN